MVIPLHSLPSSREVNCKQIYKSEHCFSALKQSGTIILCLYKHNFALLELTADEVCASTGGSSAPHHGTWAGSLSERDPTDQQAQWWSLQPAHFLEEEDGSGRAARLSGAVVAERSYIFLPPYPGINPVWVFCKGRFHLTKHTFQHPPWKSPLSFKTFARFPTRSPNCARQHQSCDPALAPKHWGPCVPTTDCCSLTPGVRPGMMLQHQLRDHAIKGQRLVS